MYVDKGTRVSVEAAAVVPGSIYTAHRTDPVRTDWGGARVARGRWAICSAHGPRRKAKAESRMALGQSARSNFVCWGVGYWTADLTNTLSKGRPRLTKARGAWWGACCDLCTRQRLWAVSFVVCAHTAGAALCVRRDRSPGDISICQSPSRSLLNVFTTTSKTELSKTELSKTSEKTEPHM